MQCRDSPQAYGSVSKLLHWGLALLMLACLATGWYLVELSYYDPQYQQLSAAHFGLGLLLLPLAITRLAWRVHSRAPELLPMPAWQGVTVRWVHGLLLLATLALPLTGYLFTTATGSSLLLPLELEAPSLLLIDEALTQPLIALHAYGAYGTLVLISLHALAACKHQWWDGDGTLKRML